MRSRSGSYVMGGPSYDGSFRAHESAGAAWTTAPAPGVPCQGCGVRGAGCAVRLALLAEADGLARAAHAAVPRLGRRVGVAVGLDERGHRRVVDRRDVALHAPRREHE